MEIGSFKRVIGAPSHSMLNLLGSGDENLFCLNIAQVNVNFIINKLNFVHSFLYDNNIYVLQGA